MGVRYGRGRGAAPGNLFLDSLLLCDSSISFHLPSSTLNSFHPSTGLPELFSFSLPRPLLSGFLEVKIWPCHFLPKEIIFVYYLRGQFL